jgi:hypothetical protein
MHLSVVSLPGLDMKVHMGMICVGVAGSYCPGERKILSQEFTHQSERFLRFNLPLETENCPVV